MQGELHLSAGELGVLLSAFYYGYVLAMAPVGWLAEKYGAQRVLATCAGRVVAGDALHRRSCRALRDCSSCACCSGSAKAPRFRAPPSSLPRRCGRPPGRRQRRPELRLSLRSCGRHVAWWSLMTRFGWRPVFVLFGVCRGPARAWRARAAPAAPSRSRASGPMTAPAFHEISEAARALGRGGRACSRATMAFTSFLPGCRSTW